MRWKPIIAFVAITCMVIGANKACAEELTSLGSSYDSDLSNFSVSDCGGGCEVVCVCEPEPCYSIGANLLWLGRDKAESVALLGSPANLAIPTTQHLNSSELAFDVRAGVETVLRAHRASGQTWELRYFGVYDQEGRQRRTFSDGDMVTTNDMTIIHLNSLHGSYTDLTTVYSSDLHSGEVNVWLNERWGFEPVLGFRWIHQAEDLESFVTSNFGEGSLIAFSNDMYGGQFGVRRILWETPARYRVEATLKGGVFSNSTHLQGETRTGAVTTVTNDSSFMTTSYAFEASISAVYRFTPHLSARIGYTGLWLDRVGLAADQIDDSFLAPGTTDLTTLIYQGGHLGIEYSW